MPQYFWFKIKFEGSDEIIKDLTPDKTLADLKNSIISKFSKLNNDNFNLSTIEGDEMTETNKSLKDYGFNYKPVPIAKSVMILYEAIGGTMQKPSFPNEVESIKAKCIISLEIEDCIYMDCNHYISHASLCGHITRTKEKDFYSKIICPVQSCKKVWDYEECLYYANFDKKKNEEYLEIFKKRYMGQNISECPGCKAFNKRDRKKVKIYRLACGSCGLNFCDYCKQKWKKSGFVLCGNTYCQTYETQEALNKCKMLPKDKNNWTKAYPDKSIPAVRACPSCWEIIKHREGCLHMTCPHCGHEFCYACLKDWGPHDYYNQQCFETKPVGRQQL